MTSWRSAVSVVAASLIVIVVIYSTDSTVKEQPSDGDLQTARWLTSQGPDLEMFGVQYSKIREGMTEKEVDEILTEFNPGDRYKCVRKQDAYMRLFRVPSAFAKMCFSNPNANEGDWVIQVYFDEDLRVLGKDLVELSN